MRRRDDSGAALVLVLVLVTVLGLGIAALLSFSDTSVRTTVALRGQAANSYGGDAAMQAAVNTIRNSTYNGTSGHCFGASNTLALTGFGDSGQAKVACETEPARVRIACPSLTDCNRPGNAILTLGKVAGEDGLNIQQPTGSTLRVHGNVFSNSNINVVNGALNTNAAVTARSGCAGAIQSNPAPNCNFGSAANPLGDDPGYVPENTTMPAYQSMSASVAGSPAAQCNANGPGSVIVFQPGYYDDAKTLSAMMAGNSACRHSTWWFRPGNYYFDFHNSGTGANPVLGATTNLWTVDDGYLVAGSPAGGASAPPVPPSIPGSCVNPINDIKAIGVQFVFGNDSQFAVKSGQAEICGSYLPDRPPVAVYGLKSGAETATPPSSLKLTSAAGQFANPANATDFDTSYATWTPTGNGTHTGTLTATGFAPPAAAPAGSNLGSVPNSSSVVVRHLNAAGSNTDTRTVTITPKSAAGAAGTPITLPVPSYNDNLWHTDQLDLTGNSAFAQFVHDNGFSGATIAYSATLKHNDTESVDALQLAFGYTAPAYRAESGCVTAGPYTGVGSTSCALVSTINNSGNQFYVQGTTYAPNAAIDVTFNNAAEQVFRFGVVSRTLWLKLTGSFSYTGVVIEVPDDSPGFAFAVYLTAYLCPLAQTCPPVLGSKVAYVDANPAVPVAGKRQVVVLSWTRPG